MLHDVCAVDEGAGQLVAPPHLSVRHEYPPTKLQFLPDTCTSKPDLMVRAQYPAYVIQFAMLCGWSCVLG